MIYVPFSTKLWSNVSQTNGFFPSWVASGYLLKKPFFIFILILLMLFLRSEIRKKRKKNLTFIAKDKMLNIRGRSQTTLTGFWPFLSTCPLRWHFLPYKRWKNKIFLDYLPPPPVNVFCERPLRSWRLIPQ